MVLGRPMRTLAIECATEACSVALFEEGALLAGDFRVLGRGHAEHLVPMIAALRDRGQAQRILVSLGPGSFTGIRIGIAVAGALAIAWRAEVKGYPTLSLVAAMASPAGEVTVSMAGGHGEWFVQDFAAEGRPASGLASLTPHDAAGRGAQPIIAGSRARDLADLLPDARRVVERLPDAREVLRLAPELLSATIAPVYGRGPDARLPS